MSLEPLVQPTLVYGLFVGSSSMMTSVYEFIEKVAETDTSVLITGETGTGKELVARAIHWNSSRKGKPFVVINCPAIPDQLAESEFFGHEKGAFTNAIQRKLGKFELANRGTIFLDEISTLTPETQVKLLRTLQEKTIERVGGTELIKVDVRILAATSANLEEAIRCGTFRDDLYYRLKVVSVSLPPLRDRMEDIPDLVKHFIFKR